MNAILKKAQLQLWASGWVGVLLMVNSWKRERMSHDNGLTARGRIRITDKPEFPEHDFFQPGRQFECRLRHASVSYADDTIIQVRGASLKFADSDYASPLDLELNTGTISLFWTARNFVEFARHKTPRIDELAYSTYYDKYPRGLLAGADGIRKDPSSFAQLYYHSQCALRFVGRDGVTRYAKYRLVPGNRGPETGLMREEALRHRWREAVAPGETRSPHYLKEEFAERLQAGPVTYHLQIQLHTPQPGESEEILNCNVVWDEATHPHLELATVELDVLLPYEQNELMHFSMANAPPSLGVLPSESIDDYNSINYMRARSDSARRARVLLNRLLGPRKILPDTRSSPALVGTPPRP